MGGFFRKEIVTVEISRASNSASAALPARSWPSSASCRNSLPLATSIRHWRRAPSTRANGSAPTTTRSSAFTSRQVLLLPRLVGRLRPGHNLMNCQMERAAEGVPDSDRDRFRRHVDGTGDSRLRSPRAGRSGPRRRPVAREAVEAGGHRARGGAAVPRPRGGDSVRRLRHQRRRHAEPARGGAAALSREPVRPHEHQQGLRRPPEHDRPHGAARPAGTTPTPPSSHGIPETFPIDQSLHSLFGASKVAADVMVQEYGRYFGMPTCCLRGGCLTGPNHTGVELHGFLSYLVKCNLEGREYRVFGYKGKQVRDNIHSHDVARFMHAFVEEPPIGRGLQPRRRQGQLLLHPRSVRAGRATDRQAAAVHATSTRTASATTSATTATCGRCGPTIPPGTCRSAWSRPAPDRGGLAGEESRDHRS